MEKIIWQDDYQTMYVKQVKGDISYIYHLIIGIKAQTNSWEGNLKLNYQAEDGFLFDDEELKTKLKNIIDNNLETQLNIIDEIKNTDSSIVFDCKKDTVRVSGNLGNTIDDTYQLSFSFIGTKQILVNLYNYLKENPSEYEE